MTPYTPADAEQALRAALNAGDPTQIAAATRLVDTLDTKPPVAGLHAAALWYAEQGLRVFPLTPASKVPLKGSRGCHDATTDPATITAWWETTPDANIGLATGTGVDVIDIDGPVGQASRAGAWGMFEALEPLVLARVSTPRAGGMHLYVPATDRGNKAGILPGIDYRSVGGYVVAPPSVTPAGSYRFLVPLVLPAVGQVAA